MDVHLTFSWLTDMLSRRLNFKSYGDLKRLKNTFNYNLTIHQNFNKVTNRVITSKVTIFFLDDTQAKKKKKIKA